MGSYFRTARLFIHRTESEIANGSSAKERTLLGGGKRRAVLLKGIAASLRDWVLFCS